MTIRFERVHYRSGGVPRWVLLEVAGEDEQFLRGFQVDREGDRVQPANVFLAEHGAVDGQVMYVLDKETITSRIGLVQDHLHGLLVPAGTATHWKEGQP